MRSQPASKRQVLRHRPESSASSPPKNGTRNRGSIILGPGITGVRWGGLRVRTNRSPINTWKTLRAGICILTSPTILSILLTGTVAPRLRYDTTRLGQATPTHTLSLRIGMVLKHTSGQVRQRVAPLHRQDRLSLLTAGDPALSLPVLVRQVRRARPAQTHRTRRARAVGQVDKGPTLGRSAPSSQNMAHILRTRSITTPILQRP